MAQSTSASVKRCGRRENDYRAASYDRWCCGCGSSARPAWRRPSKAPTRVITNIAGDLYRFQNNFHFSVFYVTDAGIIATDPISADAADWLKAELQSRFAQPVKYLIYSHDHADHISGGEVFENATVIAHAQAKADIVGEQRPTAVPDITFEDELTVELGGQTVELKFVGRNHSNNMIVMHFPAERTLFAVDFIPVKSVAFRDFTDGFVEEWIDSLKSRRGYGFRRPGAGARTDGWQGGRYCVPRVHGGPLQPGSGCRARRHDAGGDPSRGRPKQVRRMGWVRSLGAHEYRRRLPGDQHLSRRQPRLSTAPWQRAGAGALPRLGRRAVGVAPAGTSMRPRAGAVNLTKAGRS